MSEDTKIHGLPPRPAAPVPKRLLFSITAHFTLEDGDAWTQGVTCENYPEGIDEAFIPNLLFMAGLREKRKLAQELPQRIVAPQGRPLGGSRDRHGH